MHSIRNTYTTCFNYVGNYALWNKFVYNTKAYWASFIRRVVLKKSSGHHVLVVRYENIKRNRAKEVDKEVGGKMWDGEEILLYFTAWAIITACHCVCLGITHLGLSKYELFTTRSEKETAGGCHNISTQANCEH